MGTGKWSGGFKTSLLLSGIEKWFSTISMGSLVRTLTVGTPVLGWSEICNVSENYNKVEMQQ